MSTTLKQAEIINQYLCQIKKELPLSIRLNKVELNSILDEIEEHIWDKVMENIESEEPNEIELQIAISQIGDAKEIAEKYTTKSTPHIFISEELYPLFLKGFKFILFSLFLTFIFPYDIYFNNLNDYYAISALPLYLFPTIYIVYSTLLVINVVIFFYISTRGYLQYEARISKFYRKFPQPIQLKEERIKHPINLKSSILSTSLIILVLLLFVLLSIITTNPDFYNIFLLSGLLIINLLKFKIKKRSYNWYKVFFIIELVVLYFLIVYHAIIDISIQDGYSDLDPFVAIASFLRMWLIPVYYIVMNFKVYQIFTIKGKFERYLTFLSLRKRIITQYTYINKSQNYHEMKSNPIRNSSSEASFFEDNNFYKKEIDNYLKKSRKLLPFWLKRSERKTLLNEIESQIKEVILEYENKEELSSERLFTIFQEVADFDNLIFDLKKKGTPKIFISKELWSSFLISLKSTMIYYLIISIFTILLQISFGAVFSLFSIFFIYYWLLFLITLSIISYVFIYFSINDYVPIRRDSLRDTNALSAEKNYIHNFERSWGIFFVVFGIIMLICEIIPNYFSIHLNEILPATLIVICIFALGITKLLQLKLGNIKMYAEIGVKILILSLSLIISFSQLYNYHLSYQLIHSELYVNVLSLIFIPINIEILYDTFRLNFTLFKNKVNYPKIF